MEVLSSRFLVHATDAARSRRFYRDTLGLAVYREFGSRDDPGVVFHLGGGFLEVSAGPADADLQRHLRASVWLQVRDLWREHARLIAAGVPVLARSAARAVGSVGGLDRGSGRATPGVGGGARGSPAATRPASGVSAVRHCVSSITGGNRSARRTAGGNASAATALHSLCGAMAAPLAGRAVPRGRVTTDVE